MDTKAADSTWRSYEHVAAELLNRFASDLGLSRVEGKQSIVGKDSGTNWEIDAKGFRQDNDGIVLIECRRFTTSKQNQERLASLAYRIIDTGAIGGIIVSPLGLQSGAELIANAKKIISVKLHADSTPTEFAMQFLDKIFLGVHDQIHLTDKIELTLTRICTSCKGSFAVQGSEMTCPECCNSSKSNGAD